VLRAGAWNVSTNPLVPWPRRPLPPTRSNFTSGSPGFAALRIKNGDLNGTNNADFNGIGVAIGTTSVAVKSGSSVALGRKAWINGATDPDSLLFKDTETDLPILGQVVISGTTVRPPGIEMPFFLIGQPAVSAVLYRQQIPSAAFPQPPGDIIQVTPLIDGIEYNTFTDLITAPPGPVTIPGTRLDDPFIGLFPYGTGQGLFLLDTQPIISGATYQYFLVRFDEYGEMIEVLPTNPVTATP
jgi:hypothetical protein